MRRIDITPYKFEFRDQHLEVVPSGVLEEVLLVGNHLPLELFKRMEFVRKIRKANGELKLEESEYSFLLSIIEQLPGFNATHEELLHRIYNANKEEV